MNHLCWVSGLNHLYPVFAFFVCKKFYCCPLVRGLGEGSTVVQELVTAETSSGRGPTPRGAEGPSGAAPLPRLSGVTETCSPSPAWGLTARGVSRGLPLFLKSFTSSSRKWFPRKSGRRWCRPRCREGRHGSRDPGSGSPASRGTAASPTTTGLPARAGRGRSAARDPRHVPGALGAPWWKRDLRPPEPPPPGGNPGGAEAPRVHFDQVVGLGCSLHLHGVIPKTRRAHA